MTPLEAYEDTAERARYLLKLHDGLINIRRRGIRADWKRSFTKLMHWPANAQIERVDGRGAVLVLRAGAQLVPDDFSQTAMQELLRSALAVGVSAFDRYVHERVTKGIVTALKRGERSLNKEQKEFSIPALTAIRITRVAAAARRAGTATGTRPANEIRKTVQEIIHRRPFQSWRDVEEAFKLIGITGLAGHIQTGLRLASAEVFKTRLQEINRRRNQIVHEGDLRVYVRGGTLQRHEIQHAYVADSITFLDSLVAQFERL